jgi:hypothetical protein
MEGFPSAKLKEAGMSYRKVVNDLTTYAGSAYAGQKSWRAFAFGACVSELDSMERDLPLRPNFYQELHKVKQVDCDDINKSTRFDVLFDKIRERHTSPHGSRDRLSIVVTDLFLDEGSRILGGVSAALAPIQPILDSGLAVACSGSRFRSQARSISRPAQPNRDRRARLQRDRHA